MEKNEIDRLLEGRRITEEYERDYPTKGTAAKWDFIAKLQELGFNSPAQFVKWNEKMNHMAFIECVPLTGECDMCKGYEGEPPCLQIFDKNSSLYLFPCWEDVSDSEKFSQHLEDLHEWVDSGSSKTAPFNHLTVIFRLIKIGHAHMDMDKTKTRNVVLCPPGHGLHVDTEKMKDLPFDIHWTRIGLAGELLV